MSVFDDLAKLSSRFQGVDVQHRRSTSCCNGGEWKGDWRVRLLTSKNQRREYRITVYAATAERAIGDLIRHVEAVDHGWPAHHEADCPAVRTDHALCRCPLGNL